MSEVNFDDFKCRCSSISKILSNSRSNPVLTEKQTIRMAELEAKETLTANMQAELADLYVKKENGSKIVLSDTCIEYLMEWYAWEVEGMIATNKETLDTLAMNKGKMVEGASGMLLSMVDGEIYKQHKDRIYNEYLSGEIDWYLGDSVYTATRIADTKNAMDYPTFLKKVNQGVINGQKEQVQGYCDITGAREGLIVNALVSNPKEIIDEFKFKIMKKLNVATEYSPDFVCEWEKWERSMNFDNIPVHKRIHKIKIEPFTDFEQQRLYDRVKLCREWLWNFHEMYESLNV